MSELYKTGYTWTGWNTFLSGVSSIPGEIEEPSVTQTLGSTDASFGSGLYLEESSCILAYTMSSSVQFIRANDEGTYLTFGSAYDTLINPLSYEVCKVDNTSFIYSYKDPSFGKCKSQIMNVTENDITSGSITEFDTNFANKIFSVDLITSSSFLVTYNAVSGGYVGVLSIEDNTLISGASTQFDSTITDADAVVINANLALVLYNDSTNSAVIKSISLDGTSITEVSDKSTVNSDYGNNINIKKISESLALVALNSYDEFSFGAYLIPISITGSEISVGERVRVYDSYSELNPNCLNLIRDNYLSLIFINSEHKMNVVTIDIENSIPSVREIKQLNSFPFVGYPLSYQIDEEKILIAGISYDPSTYDGTLTTVGIPYEVIISGTHYDADDTIVMGTSDITLYAEWKEEENLTVTYNENNATSGTVPVDSNTYNEGDTVTVLYNGD